MVRPTLANWMAPEHTFWSFRNVRELIPTAQVDCAARPRVLLSDIKPALGGLVVDFHQGQQTIVDFLSSTYTDSFIVVQGEN